MGMFKINSGLKILLGSDNMIRMGRFLVEAPLGAQADLGTQPRYETPCDFGSK